MKSPKRPVGRPKNPDNLRTIYVHVSEPLYEYVRGMVEKNRRTIRATVEDIITFHRDKAGK